MISFVHCESSLLSGTSRPSQLSPVMIRSMHMVGTLGIDPSDYDLIRIASSPVE